MARRIAAVAGIRLVEGLRGPVLVFLILFLVAASAAALLTPGEPGIDRQRAVDGYVLDIARLVSAFAAIALASASLPGDRESSREALLRATPLRAHELLIGGFAGHLACLAVLLLGVFLGTLSVSGFLAGGDRDRRPTRTKLSASALRLPSGEEVRGRWTYLTDDAPEAVYEVDHPKEAFPFGELPDGVAVWIKPRELLGHDVQSIPNAYPVGLKVGTGPERILQINQKSSVRFTLTDGDLKGGGPLELRIRRMHPTFILGLHPGGLAIQGRQRSFHVNLLKSLLGWFLALFPLVAVAMLFSVLVGAPVAAAGALILLVFGYSHGLLQEAVVYAEQGLLPVSGAGGHVLGALGHVTPNLPAYDFSLQVAERWDIPAASLFERVPPSLLGSALLLAGAWVLLALVRRSSS